MHSPSVSSYSCLVVTVSLSRLVSGLSKLIKSMTSVTNLLLLFNLSELRCHATCLSPEIYYQTSTASCTKSNQIKVRFHADTIRYYLHAPKSWRHGTKKTNSQSNLTKDRITVAYRRFNRIRQVARMHPQLAHGSLAHKCVLQTVSRSVQWGWELESINVRHHAKAVEDRSNRCRDMVIERFQDRSHSPSWNV